MIKVGKTIKELDLLAKNFYAEVLTKLDLQNRVSIKLNAAIIARLDEEEKFYCAIDKHLKSIIVGRPDQLEILSNQLNPLYYDLESYRLGLLLSPKKKDDISKTKKDLKNEVLSLFDYSFFTNDKNGSWAYLHASRFELNVCPYCNGQYTFTVRTSNGKTRPQFDHFFNKSKHPYFAMSFYNLIPSCYVCNSNLKGQKVFKPSTHIHPFIEGVEDTLHFRTNIDKVDFLMGKKDFEITLQEVSKKNPSKIERAKKSVNVFHIEEQYTFHKAYAGEIICKAYLYSDSKINELIDDFNGTGGFKLFSSKEEIVEMLFGNYLREEKLHERVLAKLTKNIANEMGIKI